jgi:hypothetical protein
MTATSHSKILLNQYSLHHFLKEINEQAMNSIKSGERFPEFVEAPRCIFGGIGV